MRYGTMFLLSVGASAAILNLAAVDAPAGYALANGRRVVHILATMRADASTMSAIDGIKKALPEMQAALPLDIKVSFEFDQSPVSWRSA